MKSGKSLDLIAAIAPHTFSNATVGLFHSTRNVRDDNIESLSGVKALAKKVSLLSHIPDAFDVIVIDEIHMFTKIEARE